MPTVGSSDGVVIAYEVAGSGAPLVLVAGALNDHTLWSGVLPRLTKSFTVYAMDRRGRGGSGDRAGSTVDDEIGDVRAVLDVAGEGAVLVGHSSGAVLALRAAARRSGLAAVVAYEPPPAPPTPMSGRLRALTDAGDRDGALALFMEIVGTPADAVAGMRGTPAWTSLLPLAHTLAYDLAIVEQGLPPDEAAAVAAPVRLLLGGDSGPFMADNVRMVAGRLPNAHVNILEGQQHSAIGEAPDAFADQVVSLAEG